MGTGDDDDDMIEVSGVPTMRIAGDVDDDWSPCDLELVARLNAQGTTIRCWKCGAVLHPDAPIEIQKDWLVRIVTEERRDTKPGTAYISCALCVTDWVLRITGAPRNRGALWGKQVRGRELERRQKRALTHEWTFKHQWPRSEPYVLIQFSAETPIVIATWAADPRVSGEIRDEESDRDVW